MFQKKINIVIGSLGIGGAERHLCQVLPRIRSCGWDVEVVTLSANNPLKDILLEKGIHIREPLLFTKKMFAFDFLRKGLLVLSNLFRLIKIFRKCDRSEIVHFFLPEAYILGMISARIACFRGPLVMSRRSMNCYQSRRVGMRSMELRLHQRVTAVLGNSMRVLEQLHIDEGVSTSKTSLIYNGIDLMPFERCADRDKLRNGLGISSCSLVFAITANLYKYKGHKDLLEALGQIKNKLPSEWCLICVGRDAGALNELQKQSKESGISNNILWLGSREDIPNLFQASDIGILCSHEEGFSNAILEGMAAGLPMVVTDVGGNSEAVEDGKTGFVVPAHNPKRLGNALLKLTEDSRLREKMGDSGRRRVKEKFTVDTCVAAYIKFYSELMSSKAP